MLHITSACPKVLQKYNNLFIEVLMIYFEIILFPFHIPRRRSVIQWFKKNRMIVVESGQAWDSQMKVRSLFLDVISNHGIKTTENTQSQRSCTKGCRSDQLFLHQRGNCRRKHRSEVSNNIIQRFTTWSTSGQIFSLTVWLGTGWKLVVILKAE